MTYRYFRATNRYPRDKTSHLASVCLPNARYGACLTSTFDRNAVIIHWHSSDRPFQIIRPLQSTVASISLAWQRVAHRIFQYQYLLLSQRAGKSRGLLPVCWPIRTQLCSSGVSSRCFPVDNQLWRSATIWYLFVQLLQFLFFSKLCLFIITSIVLCNVEPHEAVGNPQNIIEPKEV